MLTTRNRILVIFSTFFLIQCTSQQVLTQEESPAPTPAPPPATLSAEEHHCFFEPGYVETPTLTFDLVHTRLEGRLNWEDQTFPATATLRLTPHFYGQNTLTLDAKGMDIRTVACPSHPQIQVTQAYDQRHLQLAFSDSLFRGDTLTLEIDYVAQPEVWAQWDSLNPRTAKGLYFIDPLDTLPYYPRQAWTQGQATGSSVWYPTIDHPNQRMTQELLITVADSMTTFSNGELVAQKPLPNGQRQDHWRLDQPHAPYLTALAVGQFDIVTDTAGSVPLAYYMEPEWSPHAAAVFGATKPMMTVFEETLGVPYPWPVYRQIAVRDFIAGGMENTGATIMYDNMNVDASTLMDRDFEGLIAHELFHQWFGDMVTTESWPQLVLNEGMASYGEFVWARAAGGKDREQYEAQNDKRRYLAEVYQGRPASIVRMYEPRPGAMFNRHTYQKGALVFRMLENYLGREAFFAGLKYYLQTHAYQAVDVHDMRLAFEEVSGKDLLWFFDQWLYDAGHPIIRVSYAEGSTPNQTEVALEQIHLTDTNQVYRLPLPIYVKGNLQWIDWHSADTTLFFEAATVDIRVDPDRTVLAEWQDERSKAMWESAMLQGSYAERLEALTYFSDSATFNAAGQMLALQDKFWALRVAAIRAIEPAGSSGETFKQKLMQMAVNDPNSRVRSAALSRLLNYSDPALTSVFMDATRDSSYAVIAQGLIGLTTFDQQAAMRQAPRYEDAPLQALILAVGYVYAYTPVEGKGDFFLRRNHRINRGATAEWYGYIGSYFRKSKDPEEVRLGMQLLQREVQTQRSGQLAAFAFNMMQRIRQGWLTELNELRINDLQNERREALEELEAWSVLKMKKLIENSPHATIQKEEIN